MRGITLAQWLTSVMLITSSLLFQTGCSTPKPERAEDKPNLVELTRFWKPHLLFLQDKPHSRLYVEIDAVAGCEPSEVTLQKLREFLTTYCHKPGGIEIVRSDVIPTSAAKGVARKALARKFIGGPPDRADAPAAAFIYILFYDGLLCDQTRKGESRKPESSSLPRMAERNHKPHVDFLPYPAIAFINTRYGPKLARDDILLHEAGHLLGLANRPELATNYHCHDTKCRMNFTIRMHISQLLLFRDPIKQHELCKRCEAQLRESLQLPDATNLRFVGPVLVRSEAGYHVLSLPSRMKLIIGDLTDANCQDFANAARTETPPQNMDGNAMRWDALTKGETDSVTTKAILVRAKDDPYEGVRTVAAKLEEKTNTR